MITIQYGNREGVHFSQWKFDFLAQLVKDIHEVIPCHEFQIWYNPTEDFHCLQFQYKNQTVLIKFYKVLTYYINDQVGWQGCLRSQSQDFILSIKRKLNTC